MYFPVATWSQAELEYEAEKPRLAYTSCFDDMQPRLLMVTCKHFFWSLGSKPSIGSGCVLEKTQVCAQISATSMLACNLYCAISLRASFCLVTTVSPVTPTQPILPIEVVADE